MSRVMLDLETLGTEPGCIIVSIGAVEFDIQAGTLGREFYRVIHAGSAASLGLTMNAATVMWWMGQSDEARNAIRFGGLHIRQVLQDFIDWAPAEMRPYGNGATFDLGILKAAYRAAGMKEPWKFWNERDHRTVKNDYLQVPEPERVGTHHNALDDAKHQALHQIAIRKAIVEARGG